MSHPQHSHRAILYAFLANLGIALAKGWAAFSTGSGSLLAETIHSIADSGNQILLYIGLVQARRPPDAEHPLGYGKLTYFWSFIVAILLFTMGGVFSIYEGWRKLAGHEGLHQPWIGIAILVFAIVLETLSLLGCLREITQVRGRRSLWQWLKTTRNAELVVILGEDCAALVGLTLALVGLGTAALTGDPIYDAMGSIAIGGILILVSLFIAFHIRTLIVGRSADPELARVVREVIEGDEHVETLLNLITLQFGPDVMVAAKLRLPPHISVREAAECINQLERRIKRTVPQVRWCFMEPDLVD